MKKTNGDMLISGILELVKMKRKELNDKIYLNVLMIRALRIVQNKNENELVKDILEKEVQKLCTENDTLYNNIVELGGN